MIVREKESQKRGAVFVGQNLQSHLDRVRHHPLAPALASFPPLIGFRLLTEK